MQIKRIELYKALEDIMYDSPVNHDYGLKVITIDDIEEAIKPLAEKHSIEPNLRNDDYRDLLRTAKNFIISENTAWSESKLEGMGKVLTAPDLSF